MKIQTESITSPIIRRESCADGKSRVITHWIIKGEKTTKERVSFGYTSLEALVAETLGRDNNRVDLGIAEERFSDVTSIFLICATRLIEPPDTLPASCLTRQEAAGAA
jgi:hypothetical protein